MSVNKGPDNMESAEPMLERLVTEYQTQLLRICYMYLKDMTLAEDAVQETFFKAYRSMETWRGDCSEKTWLCRIAVNTCRDMLRSRWFRYTDRKVTPDMLPAAEAYEPQEETLVVEVMNLPRKLREVVLLYYYHGMDVNDIAKALGIARTSVSDRLSRARKALRVTLEEERK